MKLVDGVALHLIQNEQFKMNHLTFRFSGEFQQETVAKRVLVAQILATANATYPTAQRFRERLASLYGASLSTKVSTKGLVHIVDIEISFLKNRLVKTGENILEDIIDFLYHTLFSPLITVEQYHDDSFYSSELGLKKIFYDSPVFQVSKYGTADLVAAENSYTAYQEFQKMLREDQLDIFLLGEFDDYRMLQLFNKFPFENRDKTLRFAYNQDKSNVIREQVETREVSQSVLQLGYYFPTRYFDEDYATLLVFNGLFGGFSHSRLFEELREKEGLAYTIGSCFDIYTGLLNVYAGIDAENQMKVLKLINKQLSHLKSGRFSETFLNRTKELIKTNVVLSGDSPKATIERVYNDYHGIGSRGVDTLVKEVDNVCKADVVAYSKEIALQALYFLEGK